MISPLLLAAVVAFGPAGWPQTEADIAWISSEGFCEPETVLPLPDRTLLVSNVCNFATAGDGYLSLLTVDGDMLQKEHVTGLDSPLGMALHQGQLFVVDTNRVRVFSWPEGSPLRSIALHTRVANDIAVADDGQLFVTDTAAGKVIQVNAAGTASELLDGREFPGANGIAVRGQELWVGGVRLWRVDLEIGQVETIGPDWLADIDGIEFEEDGTVQLTPVGGPLLRYRSDADIEIVSGEGVSSANHGYSAALGLALVPTGFDNTVIAIRVPPR